MSHFVISMAFIMIITFLLFFYPVFLSLYCAFCVLNNICTLRLISYQLPLSNSCPVSCYLHWALLLIFQLNLLVFTEPSFITD